MSAENGSRRPLIAGNWKMHKTAPEAAAFMERLAALTAEVEGTDILVCPPFTALYSAAQAAREAGGRVIVGAQDVHEAPGGAHTGEISAEMLLDAGCTYVIVGHSERRQAGETDARVNAKVRAAAAAGLTPILCVGESLEQRRAGETEAVVAAQVRAGFEGVDAETVGGAVVAYEPVWAIGTGETATPEEASRVAGLLRRTIGETAGSDAARTVRIQYGGSVNEDNIASFMRAADVDGALVGGASLQAESFARIVLRTEATMT